MRYGLAKYEDEYRDSDENNLQLYQKYSRRDICRLLNWGKDEGSTIYGYRIKHGTCPIFVTYEKKEDISESTKYEDQFVDSKLFSWMTRSRVKIDFYYMGPVEPISHEQKTSDNDKGKKLPIMNFKLKLKHPVRNDIYDYITK